MSLPYYIIRRFFQALPLLLGVLVINFLIIHSAPGDPVLVIVGEYGTTPEYMDMMWAKLGLDKPLHLQLLIYLKTTLSGDLGHSFVWEEPVLKVILEFVPATLLLMGTSLIISAFFGISMGVWSAKDPDSFKDITIRTICLAGAPDVADERDPWAAFENRKGGRLMILSKSDGEILAEHELGSAPVYDGMAAADDKLFIALKDGSLICLGKSPR